MRPYLPVSASHVCDYQSSNSRLSALVTCDWEEWSIAQSSQLNRNFAEQFQMGGKLEVAIATWRKSKIKTEQKPRDDPMDLRASPRLDCPGFLTCSPAAQVLNTQGLSLGWNDRWIGREKSECYEMSIHEVYKTQTNSYLRVLSWGSWLFDRSVLSALHCQVGLLCQN